MWSEQLHIPLLPFALILHSAFLPTLCFIGFSHQLHTLASSVFLSYPCALFCILWSPFSLFSRAILYRFICFYFLLRLLLLIIRSVWWGRKSHLSVIPYQLAEQVMRSIWWQHSMSTPVGSPVGNVTAHPLHPFSCLFTSICSMYGGRSTHGASAVVQVIRRPLYDMYHDRDMNSNKL